jgi:O-antigen/teichoic acid export membrane protein
MSLTRKALGHTLVFASFRAIGLAISFVSFPVLTRQLSISEYGSLALINASVTMLAAVAKCGLGMAMLRQYPSTESDPARQRALVGAAFWGTLLIWVVATGIYLLLVSRYIRAAAQLDVILASLVAIMAASTAMNDLFSALLRARDQVFKSSIFGTGLSVASVSVGLICLALAERKLFAFCAGSVCAELTILAVAWGREMFAGRLTPTRAMTVDARALFAFGFPLVLFEFSSLAMNQVDRFQIAHLIGLDAVGLYSVGYNIASYTQTLTTWPMWMALYPIYTRLWETEGEQAVSKFLSSCTHALMAASCAIVMCAVIGSADAIHILASDKFAAAATVLPIVCAAMMINGLTHLLGAGFYLKRNTAILAGIAAVAAVLKAGLNLWMIPAWGIVGAAMSTLLVYFLMTAAIALIARRMLAVYWSARRLLSYIAAAAVVAWIAMRIVIESPWLELVARGAIALPLYVGIVLLVDRPLREFALATVGRRLGWRDQSK